jgi:hypothetical protein
MAVFYPTSNFQFTFQNRALEEQPLIKPRNLTILGSPRGHIAAEYPSFHFRLASELFGLVSKAINSNGWDPVIDALP